MAQVISLIVTLLFSNIALATVSIPPAIGAVAKSKGVPSDIFYALLLQETRVKTNMGNVVPWPWSANWQGRSYRFKNRGELYTFIKDLVDNGYTSFDIGIAQVNWKYHSQRFVSLWDATDPFTNMNAAADYLNEHYLVSRNWMVATGKYHAPSNVNNANKYRNGVMRQWKYINGQS